MARGKKHSPEQIVSLLRQIEVAVANGKTTAQASKEALITVGERLLRKLQLETKRGVPERRDLLLDEGNTCAC